MRKNLRITFLGFALAATASVQAQDPGSSSVVIMQLIRAKCASQHPELRAELDRSFRAMAELNRAILSPDLWRELETSPGQDQLLGNRSLESCKKFAEQASTLSLADAVQRDRKERQETDEMLQGSADQRK